MPFTIVRNDITNMKADAIVNAANPRPLIGFGVDSGIHHKAGKQLLTARRKIGRIDFGEAAVTPAFQLDAEYVIHTASPIWKGGGFGEIALLESCYTKSLALALEYRCESIAFPLLSAGNHGFPREIALQTAVNVFSRFLMEHEMQIWLVVFDRSIFALSEQLMTSVQSFIDETYVQTKLLEEYCSADHADIAPRRLQRNASCKPIAPSFGAAERKIMSAAPSQAMQEAASAPLPHKPARKLDDLMKELDETFSQSLIRLIDQKGLKDPDVYKRANIDRKLFSKIKNNPDYKPSKATALAFAIALELNPDEARDLIGRAGYALTHSSKFDIIVEYFLSEGNYNIFELNEVLFAFDQPLMGGNS